MIGEWDTGRYHSIWFPDHLMNQLPDSLWAPEFTDLATVSHSPHRNLDAMTIIAAAAMLTKTVPLATSVTDTIRRHPVVLAQTAITLSHLSRGRFILGVGCGEKENTAPYGMPFDRIVGRFEEALELIQIFWRADGPVRFAGRFFQVENARLDAEPYEGKTPPIWIGSGGPRMLELTGKHADGWWPPSITVPEDYRAKLDTIQEAAERANRNPTEIVPAGFFPCYIGEREEIDEVIHSTFVKAIVLQIPAAEFTKIGLLHPLGTEWRGFLDFEPAQFPRERVLAIVKDIPSDILLKLMPHGTPKEVAWQIKAFVDAGLRVPRIHDFSGQAGLKFAAQSAAKVRAAEDELLRLVGGTD